MQAQEVFTKKFNIRQAELDDEYKHLHHAAIFSYLEKTRLAYLEEIGQPNTELIESGIYIVIRNVSVRYRREVFSGEISVSCENVASRGPLIIMKQRVLDFQGRVLVLANLELACVSGEQKRAIAVPAALVRALGGALPPERAKELI